MKKLMLWLLALYGCVFAEQYDVDGDFALKKADGTSASWVLHSWDGFLPAPQIRVEAENGVNYLQVREILSQHGTCVHYGKRLPARSGDRVRVSFRARGKGIFRACLYFYGDKGGWNQEGPVKEATLEGQWADYIWTFDVLDGKSGPTGFFDACIGAKPGAELDISAFRVELDPGKYRGSFPFPKEWKLFGQVGMDVKPADLTQVPAELGGRKSVDGTIRGNVLDFESLLGKGAEKCAWAFATLDSPIDCDYTIGAGADWWMAYYLNGELIFNTFPDGNKLAPVAFDNYIKTARLKKGKNVFAIQFMSGNASSTLHLAGPNELRNIAVKFLLEKITWIENFDGKNVTCGGKPQLIKGNPTPGLLSITGQGVFSTSQILPIQAGIDAQPIPAERDQYLVQSVRIQRFGREEDRHDATLSFVFADGKDSFRLETVHRAASGRIVFNAIGSTGTIASFEVPYRQFPADVLVAANATGAVGIAVNSLVDSSSQFFRCEAPFFAGRASAVPSLEFRNDGAGEAAVVVDNFLVGKAADESNRLRVPYKVELAPEFDPVKAGWKLIWNDEFDGEKVDTAKWEITGEPARVQLKEGKCVITADWANEKKETVTSASLWSYQKFQYGYFEARVKFRKEHGWWSAFWLCTHGCSNSFVDGFEIDIFEDYYLRSAQPGGKPRDILDHNLHIFAGGVLKSRNYNSRLTGGLDKYYNIGCKWTPFEISYYLDGKLIASSANHSPYQSVTFDPFYHAAGTSPLSAILSGCCGRSGGNPKDGNFPENYYVDYVRIYEYPHDADPAVTFSEKKETPFMVPMGTTLQFEAKATPNARTKSPIQAAYLFDSGFLLDYKTEPPYTFDIPLTKEFYDTTAYVKPGRSGQRLEFGCQLHAFTVFVQDANGCVANGQIIQKFIPPAIPSTPYQGKAQVLPGKLLAAAYDEGGQDVAYFDTNPENTFLKPGAATPMREGGVDLSGDIIGGVAPWEWIRYTVDIQKAGTYRATLHYGTPFAYLGDFLLLVDGVQVGGFPLKAHAAYNWQVDTTATIEVKLPAGRHVITTIPQGGGFNYNIIDFEWIQK